MSEPPDTKVELPNFDQDSFYRQIKKSEAHYWQTKKYDPCKEYKIYLGRLVRALSKNAQHTNRNLVQKIPVPDNLAVRSSLPCRQWKYRQILFFYVSGLGLPGDNYVLYAYPQFIVYLYARGVEWDELVEYRRRKLGIAAL